MRYYDCRFNLGNKFDNKFSELVRSSVKPISMVSQFQKKFARYNRPFSSHSTVISQFSAICDPRLFTITLWIPLKGSYGMWNFTNLVSLDWLWYTWFLFSEIFVKTLWNKKIHVSRTMISIFQHDEINCGEQFYHSSSWTNKDITNVQQCFFFLGLALSRIPEKLNIATKRTNSRKWRTPFH